MNRSVLADPAVVGSIMLAPAKLLLIMFGCFVLLCLLFVKDLVLKVSAAIEIVDLIHRDIESWTDKERDLFMKIKEAQYKTRREKMQKMCQEKEEEFSNGTTRMNLIFNQKDKVAYCAVPKAASSTWCSHFIQLGKYLETLALKILFYIFINLFTDLYIF